MRLAALKEPDSTVRTNATRPVVFSTTAFHRDFDASVVGFFREHLVSDGVTR
jgi:hypothetical protein